MRVVRVLRVRRVLRATVHAIEDVAIAGLPEMKNALVELSDMQRVYEHEVMAALKTGRSLKKMGTKSTFADKVAVSASAAPLRHIPALLPPPSHALLPSRLAHSFAMLCVVRARSHTWCM